MLQTLGRATGNAARVSVDGVRSVGRFVRRVFRRNPLVRDPEGGAQIFSGRIAWRRRRNEVRGPSGADITEALTHRDPSVRVRALRAIGSLSKRRAAHLVPPMLHDPHAEVRRVAAEMAEELLIDGAVFSLILGLNDDDPRVRDACFAAIHQITGRVPWDDPPATEDRARHIGELRAWWKDERMAVLVREVREGVAARKS